MFHLTSFFPTRRLNKYLPYSKIRFIIEVLRKKTQVVDSFPIRIRFRNNLTFDSTENRSHLLQIKIFLIKNTICLFVFGNIKNDGRIVRRILVNLHFNIVYDLLPHSIYSFIVLIEHLNSLLTILVFARMSFCAIDGNAKSIKS